MDTNEPGAQYQVMVINPRASRITHQQRKSRFSIKMDSPDGTKYLYKYTHSSVCSNEDKMIDVMCKKHWL
jgi:hypothetical protein